VNQNIDKMIKNKNLQFEGNYCGNYSEFLLKVGFEEISRIGISVAHRRISHQSSGVLRHTGNTMGERVVNGVIISDAFFQGKKDARIYHDKIEEHVENLGFEERDYFLISNGNLGNNFWHLSWEHDTESRVYCLLDEPFTKRVYSCLVVPRNGNPRIQKVRFNESEDLFDLDGGDISEEVGWVNYGQQILDNGRIVGIEELIDQFYDIKHVFALRDFGETQEKDKAKMEEIYGGYPERFRQNMLKELGEIPRAEYYHNVLGVNDESLFVYHSKGRFEEIAERLSRRDVRDAIILDNGGSVGCYSSWLFPEGGWLNASSRFRPDRISYIGFELKD